MYRLTASLFVFLSFLSAFGQDTPKWQRVGELSDYPNYFSNGFASYKGYLYGSHVRKDGIIYGLGYWNGIEWNYTLKTEFTGSDYLGNVIRLQGDEKGLMVIKVKEPSAPFSGKIALLTQEDDTWTTVYENTLLPDYDYLKDAVRIGNTYYILAAKDTTIGANNFEIHNIIQYDGTVKILPVRSDNSFDLWTYNDELYISQPKPMNYFNSPSLPPLVKWNGVQWITVGMSEVKNSAYTTTLYDNGVSTVLISGGQDYDNDNTKHSNVQMLVANQWVSFGSPDMTGDIYSLVAWKNKLYAYENYGGGRVWVYDGFEWSLINNQQFSYDFGNGLAKLAVYKDQLYIYGGFERIDTDTIGSIARIDLLNDSNTPPDANTDTYTAQQGKPAELPVKNNDADPEQDYLLTVIIDSPKNGTVTVTAEDQLLYIGTSTGQDSIQYRICDRGGLCDSAWAHIGVTVGINNISPHLNFTVYPNPADEYIYIRPEHPVNTVVYNINTGEYSQNTAVYNGNTPVYNANTSVFIYDITGKQVAYTRIQPYTELKMNVSSLKAGIYFIRVLSDKGTYQQKIIIQ